MCGFSGIFSKSNLSTNFILKSLESIKHRGPDNSLVSNASDFFSIPFSNKKTTTRYSLLNDEKSKVWLGFNRLSIVDVSENAMQPFYDEKSQCFFMMNGEVYNYKELKETYCHQETFISNSDSEVVFKMYLKFGKNFVKYLKGMFSIVVYNKQKNTLNAWRDRLGIKPFYYLKTKDVFAFSSEIKGLYHVKGFEKEPNFQGIAYSKYLGTCPSPHTIYKNIFSLQAGHHLEFKLEEDKLNINSYWVLEYNHTSKKIPYATFSKDIKNLCNLYSTGDVKKAIMLSGGIDSGTLAYFYGDSDLRYKALTIYQENSENNELEFAKDNAKNAGLELKSFKIPSDPDDVEIKNYLIFEDEPNYSPEPALFLSKKAHYEGYKVLYNALGPDEIFGGYPYFQKVAKLKYFYFMLNLIPNFLLSKKASSLKKFGLHNFAFISRSVFSWEEITSFLLKNNQEIPEHPISFLNKQVNKLYPDFKKLPILKKVSYLDIFYYISSHHTFRSDVPSMKYSIEMRFPFLEHTFIEKYFNQSNTFTNIKNEIKPQMRAYSKKYLSEKVMNMQKKGFTIDVDQWLNKNKSYKEWYLKGLKEVFNKIRL